MSALLVVSQDNSWPFELKRLANDLSVRVYPDIGNPEEIDYALVWMPPIGLLKRLPNLKVVFSLAAGVDHILRDDNLPPNCPIVRMSTPAQVSMVSHYAVLGVLYFHRELHVYRNQQENLEWRQWPPRYTPDDKAVVLGIGTVGSRIAVDLKRIGFNVHGWSRNPRTLTGVTCHFGPEGLAEAVRDSRYLVCALPATPITQGILNSRLFNLLAHGGFVVNVGRGTQLVDDDLIAALDERRLEGAFLDVFGVEPLPSDHPFWTHPRIVITPHVAGEIIPRSAVLNVVENIRRFEAGKSLTAVYDAQIGY